MNLRLLERLEMSATIIGALAVMIVAAIGIATLIGWVSLVVRACVGAG
jgi:hypothetical protein